MYKLYNKMHGNLCTLPLEITRKTEYNLIKLKRAKTQKGSKHYEHQVKGYDDRKRACKERSKPLSRYGSCVDHRQASRYPHKGGRRNVWQQANAA